MMTDSITEEYSYTIGDGNGYDIECLDSETFQTLLESFGSGPFWEDGDEP